MENEMKPQVSVVIRSEVEPILDIEQVDLHSLLARIGDSRVVLLGEATHGTSEFYRMRVRITRELIPRLGFNIVAVEVDWPDAARIDRYVRDSQGDAAEWKAFARFPTWMWRNQEVLKFMEWLKAHNDMTAELDQQVGFYGLDLYSLYTSIGAVLDYLERTDPETARIARERYSCLTYWKDDPALYGRAAVTGNYETCEEDVTRTLKELLDRRLEYMGRDGGRFMDAVQNTKLVANAERYYRIIYFGSRESWNLRDQHMFETFQCLSPYFPSNGSRDSSSKRHFGCWSR